MPGLVNSDEPRHLNCVHHFDLTGGREIAAIYVGYSQPAASWQPKLRYRWAYSVLRKKPYESGGTATLVQSVPVNESFDGNPVWQGTVHVFDLEGHPKANRAYAWSSPIEGSDKRRFFAVLHMGGITGPVEAVRAAIVAERRARE